MAGMKVWVPGEEVLAADLQGFVQTQVVAVFTTAAQRASQWPTPPRGAHSFLSDTGVLDQYNGTAWGTVAVTALVTAGAATVTGALRLVDGHLNADAGLYLRAGTGPVNIDAPSGSTGVGNVLNAYPQVVIRNPGWGTVWNMKPLVISAGANGANPVGITLEGQSPAGQIMFQLYTSSQTVVGFHCVKGDNSGYVSLTASNLAVPSERDLKRDVTPLELESALAVVDQLQPVTYTNPPPVLTYPDDYPGGPPDLPPPPEPGVCLGLVVEDVAAAGAPRGVVHPRTADGTPATIDLMGLITLLTAAVQELTARVVTLEGTPA
jgi:hypothetical protein